MPVISGFAPIFEADADTNAGTYYYGPFESPADPGAIFLYFRRGWDVTTHSVITHPALLRSASRAGTSWAVAEDFPALVDPATSTVLVAYDKATSRLAICYKDVTPDILYLLLNNISSHSDTLEDIGAVFGFTNPSSVAVGFREDGKIAVFAQHGTTVYYTIYDGGAFSSVQSISPLVSLLSTQALPTFENQVYLISGQGTTSAPLKVTVIDALGVAGTPTVVTTADFFSQARKGLLATVAGNQLFITASTQIYWSADDSATVFSSLPYAVSNFAGALLLTDGTNASVLELAQDIDFDANVMLQDQVLRRDYVAGVWSDSLLDVDFMASPPLGIGVDYPFGAHFHSATRFDDNTYGMAVNFWDVHSVLCVPFYGQLTLVPVETKRPRPQRQQHNPFLAGQFRKYRKLGPAPARVA